MPRSSVRKYNLTLANSIGLIDHDYRGEILVCFKYNWQPEDFTIHNGKIEGKINSNKIYKKGDKICQVKFTQVERAGFYLVDNLDSTERGEGGFGSTDNTAPKNAIQDLTNLIQNYKKNPVYTPEKKYIDLMKERENNI
jgi:dUTPase